MDKQKKIKIIIFCIFGICALLIVYIIIKAATGSSSSQDQALTNMSTQEESNFTVDDMMKINSKNQHSNSESGSILASRNQREYNLESPENGRNESEDVYQSADPDVIRLQQALKNGNGPTAPKQNTSSGIVKNGQTQPTVLPVQQATQQKTVQPTDAPVQNVSVLSNAKDVTQNIIEQIQDEKPQKRNRFFRAEENKVTGNTVSAVVHGEQTVSDKSTLKIRLLEDLVTLDGTLIPKDTYIYGVVSISAERININIASVKMGKNIYNLKRDVYDQDGLMGINVPENIKAEIAKRTTQDAIRESDVNTNRGNILERTAGSVVTTTKNILSKDAGDIKVTIKSNYKIYLK